MKRVRQSLLVLLTCLLALQCFGQAVSSAPAQAEGRLIAVPAWIAQSSGVLVRLTGVHFADRDNGWIVGSDSTVLSTSDGGTTWKKTKLINHELLRDVFFFDEQRGFLLGEYSLFNRTDNKFPAERSFLMSTSDAGQYWRLAPLARPVYLKTDALTRYAGEVVLRMYFTSDRVGWVCGETGLILSTRDGGRVWMPQRAAQVKKILYGLTAIDDLQAWIVGAGGVALHTVDGGEQWNEQSTGTTRTLLDVHFLDAKRGWAVGAGGTILATSNGGNRWQPQASGTTADLNDVFFLNRQQGWVAGNRGTLLQTRDGGRTWEELSLKTRSHLTRLFFTAPDCGWVVGSNGAIFKYQIGEPGARPAVSPHGQNDN